MSLKRSPVRPGFALSICILGSVALGCGENGSGGNGGGGGAGNCSLPVTGTTPASSEVTDAIGINEFRWSSGDRLDSITVQLIGADNAELGVYTLEYPNLTVNLMSNGVSVDGESAAIAGPIVATLRTSAGETVRTVVTSKALPNPSLVRSDPDDPTLQVADIDEVLTTREISYNGATVFLDERYRQLADDVLQRRIRVAVEEAASEPTVGRRITIAEPGEDEGSLPVFVEYYVLEFLDEGDPRADADDIAQWLEAVGLAEWQTAIPLRLSMAATLSGWQRDLGREAIRCVEGDQAATEFDEDVSARVAALNLEKCAVAPISMASTLGLGLFAANPVFFGAAHMTSKLALVSAVKTAALVRQCLCLDSAGAATNDLCGPTCDGAECNNFCNTVIPPTCNSELISYGGVCRFDSDNLGNIPLGTCECVTSSGTVIPKGGDAPLAAQEVASTCADPHVDTFDDLAYSPHAAGEFVLAEAISGEPLILQARQEPWLSPICDYVAINTAAATELGGAAVFIDGSGELRIDNVPVEIPVGEGFGFDDGSGIERREESLYVFYYPDGSVASVQTGLSVDIALSVPPERSAQIRGVLGTPDGDDTNELTLRNGTALEYPVPWEDMIGTFMESWRVSQEESLFYYEPGDDTETFTIPGYPGAPTTVDEIPEEIRTQAEATCVAAGVTGSVALNDCIIDVGCTDEEGFAQVHRSRAEERVPISLSVDFADWSVEGPADPADWSFFSGDDGRDDVDHNAATTVPALLVSGREYSELILRFDMANVADTSQGLVGALFEYQKPQTANGDADDDYEALFLAWSGTAPNAFVTPSAPIGWSLVRLSGAIATADVADTFYAQQSAPGYEVLATGYAPEFGWVNRRGHQATIVYRSDRIEVTTTNFATFDEVMPLAIEAAAVGTTFGPGRVALFTLGNDKTSFRDVSIAELR